MKKDMFKHILSKNFNFHEIIKDFSIIEQLKFIPQNPEYHGEGNVYIHTKNVCDELLKLNEWKSLNNNEKVILYVTGLFHDIGKLICTKEEDGKIISPKHAINGAKLFREIFYKEYSSLFEMSFETREHICSLIKYHGLPLLFMEKENIDYNLIEANQLLNMNLLYLLSKSDLLGRECNDKNKMLNNINYFKEYSNEIGCFYCKKSFVNNYTRFKYFNSNNDIWYNDELFDTTTFDVIVMVGFPLSGKDTYINYNFKDINVISLDNIREEFNISPKKGSGKVVMIAKERAKQYLRSKTPFVWNATNITKEIRNNLCELFSSYGARVNFIYLEVPYNELLLRNKIRERYIPENVLNNMISKFDMIDNTEGYTVKYNVQY